jgi:hypothetical protein
MSTRSDSWDSRSEPDYGECSLFLFDRLFDYADWREDLKNGMLEVSYPIVQDDIGPIDDQQEFHDIEFDFNGASAAFLRDGRTRYQADIYWGIAKIVKLAEAPQSSPDRILPDPEEEEEKPNKTEYVWDSRDTSNRDNNLTIRSPFEYLLTTSKEPISAHIDAEDKRTYTFENCSVAFDCGPIESTQKFDEVFVRIPYNEIIFVDEEKKLYYAGRLFWGFDNIEKIWHEDDSDEEEEGDDDEYKDNKDADDDDDSSADDDTHKRKNKSKPNDAKKKSKKSADDANKKDNNNNDANKKKASQFLESFDPKDVLTLG